MVEQKKDAVRRAAARPLAGRHGGGAGLGQRDHAGRSEPRSRLVYRASPTTSSRPTSHPIRMPTTTRRNCRSSLPGTASPNRPMLLSFTAISVSDCSATGSHRDAGVHIRTIGLDRNHRSIAHERHRRHALAGAALAADPGLSMTDFNPTGALGSGCVRRQPARSNRRRRTCSPISTRTCIRTKYATAGAAADSPAATLARRGRAGPSSARERDW